LAKTLKTRFSTEFFRSLVVEMVRQQPETLAMATIKQLLTLLMQGLPLEIQNYLTQHTIREGYQVIVVEIDVVLLVLLVLTSFYTQKTLVLRGT
jgi:hypothetical protein